MTRTPECRGQSLIIPNLILSNDCEAVKLGVTFDPEMAAIANRLKAANDLTTEPPDPAICSVAMREVQTEASTLTRRDASDMDEKPLVTEKRRRACIGLGATLFAIAAIEVISRNSNSPPQLFYIVIVPVTYTALMCGARLGLAAASLAILHSVLHSIEVNQSVSPNHSLKGALLSGTVMVFIVLMVGWLRHVLDETKRQLWAHIVSNADAERRVGDIGTRTAQLVALNETLSKEMSDRALAEKHHRESEERLQAILDNAPAVVYLKDHDGRYVLVNRRFEELFHVSRRKVVGYTDYDIFPKLNAEEYRANDRKVLLGGKPLELEEVAPQDDGLHTYISLKFPLYDATFGVNGLCGISTDITDRKKAEEALHVAKEAAEEANRAKSRFLANISHEIRTPITAMLGAAELLSRTNDDLLLRKERGEMILRNGKHLLALIDDLLDLSRIEAATLAVRPSDVSLIDILADVVALSLPNRMQKPEIEFEVCFETSIPERVLSDRTRVTQAIGNLISNAFKFTQTGAITLRLNVDPNAPEPRLCFLVSDTGRGISDADCERIFQAFVQVPSPAPAAVSGVGLGLPLARWIAESLGGSLTVTSELGKGSTFVLRLNSGPLHGLNWILPQQATLLLDAPKLPEVKESTIRLAGRVLVADDAPDALSLVAQALTDAGAEVECATNGAEVLAKKPESFDLIILDIRMPVMDGFTAADQLRKRGFRGPVIALTASASVSKPDAQAHCVFDDIWLKPLPLATLIEKASAFLSEAPPLETPLKKSRGQLSELLAEAVTGFVETLPQRLGELEQAFQKNDQAAIRHLLHTLVGSAGIHGFAELSHFAADLMHRMRETSESVSSNDVKVLRNMVNRIKSTFPNPQACGN